MNRMVQTEHKIELKSAEIANLWTSYMNDTLLICLLSAFITNVEDQQIRSILDHSLQLSNDHVRKLTTFFQEEQLPVPDGFSIRTPKTFECN